MNENIIKKDMDKYNSAIGLKYRSDLAELYSCLQKRQYELFLLNKAYQKLLVEYQDFIGLVDNAKGGKNGSALQSN